MSRNLDDKDLEKVSGGTGEVFDSNTGSDGVSGATGGSGGGTDPSVSPLDPPVGGSLDPQKETGDNSSIGGGGGADTFDKL
jgi:hypothetical protein